MSVTTTARLTGVAYLALAVTGVLGFLVIRSALLVPGDPAATLLSLTEQSALAHGGVALEVLIVVTQALAALGFYALFRRDHPVAAFGVAAFGMANAVVILVSAVFMSTALTVVGTPALAPAGDTAAAVSLLYALSGSCWSIGGVFFGLWLIPMGWFVLATRRMPRVLGWLLVGGGIAYLLGTLTAVIAPELETIGSGLSMFATIGELWMVGYLLIRGIRPSSTATAS